MPARRASVSDSLKELVLQAGLELLDREGLHLTFDSISYARVFQFLAEEYGISVTRGSVHERIWASQDEFRREVLVESVNYFPIGGISTALFDRSINTESPEAFVQDLAARVFPEVANAPMSVRFQSVKALASWFEDPHATDTLHELLDQRAERILSKAKEEFPSTVRALGLEVRPELGITSDQATELCWLAIAALTEGSQLNLRAGTLDTTAPVPYRPGSTDGGGSWLVLSVGLIAILDFLYQPAPGPLPEPEPPKSVEPAPALRVDGDLLSDRSPSARRSRAQLRRLVLTAAVELLYRDGPNLKPDLLSYASVFRYLRDTRGYTVHRSSVHGRIWANNDEYRTEVLIRSLTDGASPIQKVTDAVMAAEPGLKPDGSVDPIRCADDVWRQAGASLSGLIAKRTVYRRLLQIKAALIDQPPSERSTALRTAVAHVEQQRMEGNKQQLRSVVLDLGFRARPETGLGEAETLQLLQMLTMTTGTGFLFNEVAGIGPMSRPVPMTRPDGSGLVEDWNPLGLAARAYFHALYELAED